MNRKQGSINFFTRFAIFTFFFACTSHAKIPKHFQHRHCNAYLTATTGFTPESFSETPAGAAIYQHLLDIVGRHSSSFMDILRMPEHSNWTVADAVSFISNDRKNLREGLTQLIGEFATTDHHSKMVDYVLRLFDLTTDPEEFRAEKQNIIAGFGNQPASMIFKNRDQVSAFVYKNWKNNRSFVAELLTAFEVKGAIALSAKVYELIPKDHLETFVNVFGRLGKIDYLNLEIDVVSINPDSGRQMWIEVKNPMQRITSRFKDSISKYQAKLSRLNDFKRIIASTPELRNAMNHQIDFVWIIRGAGVDENVRREQASKGLFMFDRSVEGINRLIDRRALEAKAEAEQSRKAS